MPPCRHPLQVYSANRYSSSPKGRWLARGIDILLHQYPSLRVAFIDTFHGQAGSQQYTALVRGLVGTHASDPDGTQELYRCADLWWGICCCCWWWFVFEKGLVIFGGGGVWW